MLLRAIEKRREKTGGDTPPKRGKILLSSREKGAHRIVVGLEKRGPCSSRRGEKKRGSCDHGSLKRLSSVSLKKRRKTSIASTGNEDSNYGQRLWKKGRIIGPLLSEEKKRDSSPKKKDGLAISRRKKPGRRKS